MNKRMIYFFICTYFLISIQFSTELHFCKGNFISLSFQSSHKSCCNSIKKSKKCCEKYNLALKKTSQEEKLNTVSVLFHQLIITNPTILSYDKNEVEFIKKVKFYYKAPPPNVHSKIFITNCSFLI
jgi:hypothetical protein